MVHGEEPSVLKTEREKEEVTMAGNLLPQKTRNVSGTIHKTIEKSSEPNNIVVPGKPRNV